MAEEVVVVASVGVWVLSADCDIGPGFDEVYFVGMHVLTHGRMEVSRFRVPGIFAQGDSEAVGFGKDGSIMHLGLK